MQELPSGTQASHLFRYSRRDELVERNAVACRELGGRLLDGGRQLQGRRTLTHGSILFSRTPGVTTATRSSRNASAKSLVLCVTIASAQPFTAHSRMSSSSGSASSGRHKWWPGAESNPRHAAFQPDNGYTVAYKSITCSACPAQNQSIHGTFLAHPISTRHIPGTPP